MARQEQKRSSGKQQRRMSKTMKVGPFRMAFPALLEPEEDDNGNEVYKMTMLFPPKYDLSEIEDAMQDVMEDAFGDEEDWPDGRNDILPKDKLFDAGKKEYAGFKKGWTAMSCRSHEMPGLIDADKNEVVKKREVYGGRWARAQITITTYDNKSKGVGVYLNHVQLLEHDEAFSGRGSAEDAFDKYAMKNDKGRSRDDDEDEEDEKPKRGRSRDRDEDEAPRTNKRRATRDDDDEDEKPRKRTRRDDDDEEDEKPRKRASSRDDDEDEKPRKRRAASRDDDDEDEEDEKPRKRRSTREEWN